MFAKQIKKIVYAFFLVGLTACSDLNSSGTTLEPQSFSFDGVKLIQPNIADGSAASTIQQEVYPIADQSRLLLRFETFLSKVDQVSINNKVKVSVTLVSSSDVNFAQSNFVICPISANWMMLATWYKAYPMGSSGTWKKPGGDFDQTGCVTTTTVSGQTLNFDVTNWVTDYVMGRRLNFGLILYSQSPNPLSIDGDTNGSYSPRIEWMKDVLI